MGRGRARIQISRRREISSVPDDALYACMTSVSRGEEGRRTRGRIRPREDRFRLRASSRRDCGARARRRLQRRLRWQRQLGRLRLERRRERKRQRQRRKRREQRPVGIVVEHPGAFVVDLAGALWLWLWWRWRQHRVRQRLEQRVLPLPPRQQRHAAGGPVQRSDGRWRRRMLRFAGLAIYGQLPVHPVQVRKEGCRLQLLAAQRRWREPAVVVRARRGAGLLRRLVRHRQRMPVPHRQHVRRRLAASLELHPRQHWVRGRRGGRPRVPVTRRYLEAHERCLGHDTSAFPATEQRSVAVPKVGNSSNRGVIYVVTRCRRGNAMPPARSRSARRSPRGLLRGSRSPRA